MNSFCWAWSNCIQKSIRNPQYQKQATILEIDIWSGCSIWSPKFVSKRLLDVNKIIVAVNGFTKLGKIEMGGITRRQRISCAQSEFRALCMNLFDQLNELAKRNFKTKITMLERKLSQISVETFVNCNSIEWSIKIIEMFRNVPSYISKFYHKFMPLLNVQRDCNRSEFILWEFVWIWLDYPENGVQANCVHTF